MDYVVGSVAALISGNLTPNRPKLVRRALTPTKHQPSPNVTPKSEFVEDRSIFLSPTLQKKKAIVKKSPKRIFQAPDLDVTEDSEGNSSLTSPNAEKVKKHLNNELGDDDMGKKGSASLKSLGDKVNKSMKELSPKKMSIVEDEGNVSYDNLPKKMKKKRNSELNAIENDNSEIATDAKVQSATPKAETIVKSPKKKMQRRKSVADTVEMTEEHNELPEADNISPKKQRKDKSNNNEKEGPIEIETNHNARKKNKKRKKKNKQPAAQEISEVKCSQDEENNVEENNKQSDGKSSKKKKNNRKNKSKQIESQVTETENDKSGRMEVDENQLDSDSEDIKARGIPNPNAITEKDSDSEHESDNEIESENEQTNEKILTKEQPESSEDEEDEKEQQKTKKTEKPEKKDQGDKDVNTADEIKRTLFVGNVLFKPKCKKEIKKVFNKYGQIETIRIRTVPVKDARVTPKLAVIRNELHPERTTVNVYVKFADADSVSKALCENNTVLNGLHLRVSRSGETGAAHDPRASVFVGNLPFAVEDETLRAKFAQCGEIVSVRIIRDKKTNAGKGFGYVNFSSKDGVELALALSDEDLTIKNRILRVQRCTHTQSHGQKKITHDSMNRQKAANEKWGRGSQGRDAGDAGAARRIMHKRKQHEGVGVGDGPPNKRQRNISQPLKEKKPRKEFVGMTAEKKKKHKFDKGQKKKKVLSEILMKRRD